MSSAKWKFMMEFMFGINGIKSEFAFVDVFCLSGPKTDLDRVKLLAAITKLFAKSSEHHIFEPGSLMDGWTWHDLSLLSPIVRPTLHSSTISAPLTEMLIDNIKPHGFDFPCKEFSIPEDKDIIVRRNSILDRWGAIELFNERFMYLYTIGNALDLAQVNLYVINISVCQYILTYVLIKLL